MRYVLLVASAGIVAAVLPSIASAQDPGRVAGERCWRAAEREANAVMGSGNPKQAGEPWLSQESNAETRVSGTGTLHSREFSYTCIYNIRNGSTYAVSVQPHADYAAPGRPGYNPGYQPGYNPGYNPGYLGNRPGADWDRGVPSWAVGKWKGFNQKNRTNVHLNIDARGQVKYNAGGQKGNATIRNGVLHQGLVRYRIERTRDGFVTIQLGDQRNVTYYTRR